MTAERSASAPSASRRKGQNPPDAPGTLNQQNQCDLHVQSSDALICRSSAHPLGPRDKRPQRLHPLYRCDTGKVENEVFCFQALKGSDRR